jgi:hypothetical protein
MIGATLVFSNPVAFGLPQARGIFLQMLKRIDASLHLMRVAHEALGTPWTFPEDFLFLGVLREELSTMGTWR